MRSSRPDGGSASQSCPVAGPCDGSHQQGERRSDPLHLTLRKRVQQRATKTGRASRNAPRLLVRSPPTAFLPSPASTYPPSPLLACTCPKLAHVFDPSKAKDFTIEKLTGHLDDSENLPCFSEFKRDLSSPQSGRALFWRAWALRLRSFGWPLQVLMRTRVITMTPPRSLRPSSSDGGATVGMSHNGQPQRGLCSLSHLAARQQAAFSPFWRMHLTQPGAARWKILWRAPSWSVSTTDKEKRKEGERTRAQRTQP